MITYEQWCRLKQLAERDRLSAAQIARALGLAPRTVRKWLKEPYRPRTRIERASVLDPFKGQIMGMLKEHPYTAVQVLTMLRDQGFNGGITIVKDYIQQIRPRGQEAYLTLSFAPGECAQVDWGSWHVISVGATRRRLSFFVMVLGYSRMLYVEFTLGQSSEHFLACHRHAFEFFGGVPTKVMVDNCTTAVRSHPHGLPPLLNPHYADFAAHYGFTVKACNVRKANEKGIVENAVGYVKHNFLSGRPLTQFDSINPAVCLWMEQIANVRIHGTTRRHPVDLFVAEKPMLKALPPHPYDCASIGSVSVDRQFRVCVDGNRYSVPAAYVGRRLVLKLYPERLCLYEREKFVAEHLRSYDRGRDFESPEHAAPVLERKRRADEQHLLTRFLALSPQAETYYRQLVERKLSWRLHLRKIVALSDVYGSEHVARALADALVYHAFSSDYIANILEQRARRLPDPGPLHLTRKQDLLDIEMPDPDLSVYDTEGKENSDEANA
ncbi:MAG: IS21 family transposase [Chloroflexota bacterium]